MNPTPTKAVIEFKITYTGGAFTASDMMAIEEVAEFYQGKTVGTTFTPGKVLGIKGYTYRITDEGVLENLRYETRIIEVTIENTSDTVDDTLDFGVEVTNIENLSEENSTVPVSAVIEIGPDLQGNSSSADPIESLQYYKVMFKAFTKILGMDEEFYQQVGGITFINETKDRAETKFFYGLTTQYEGINEKGFTDVATTGKPTSEESVGARNYNELFNEQLPADADIAKLARLSFFGVGILEYNKLNTCIIETQETPHDVLMPELSRKDPRIANGMRVDIMNAESLILEDDITYGVLSDVSFGILEDIGYAMDYSKTNNLKGIRDDYGFYKLADDSEITIDFKTFFNIYSPDEFIEDGGTLSSSLSDAFERDIFDIQQSALEGTITSEVEDALVTKVEDDIEALGDLCSMLKIIARSNIGSATNNPPGGLNVKYIKPSEALSSFYLNKFETQNPYYVVVGRTYTFHFKREVDAVKYGFEIGKCINGLPIGETEGVTNNGLTSATVTLSFTPNSETPRTLYFYSPKNAFTGGMITVLDADPSTILPGVERIDDFLKPDLLAKLLKCDEGISTANVKKTYRGVPLTFNPTMNKNIVTQINKMLVIRREYNKRMQNRLRANSKTTNKLRSFIDSNQDMYSLMDEHHNNMMKETRTMLANKGDRRARLIQ